MSSDHEYWVREWLRENHIESLKDATDLLPKYKVLDTLRQRASDFAAAWGRAELSRGRGPLILAGTGVDLWGGRMVCPGPSCMRNQVDTLLKHVWHYFDKVVVDDALTMLLVEDWEGSKADLIRTIAEVLAPLLYLVEIGASDYVEFRPKYRCQLHWAQHAEEQGLGHAVELRDELIAEVMSRGVFYRKAGADGDDVYCMDDPEAEVTVTLPVAGRSDKELKKSLAETVFEEYMVDLVADVGAARCNDLPLGSVLAFPGRILQMSRPASVADVVFQLQLPVIEGISARDLIAVRDQESEYFERFRAALRHAAQERIAQAPRGATSATIANEITADVIGPELERIGSRLAASESSLVKKTGVGLLLGTVATTCGLLYGAPEVALSAGTGTVVAATAAAALKYLETREDVSLSDMYFLWKAAGHAH
jgi:hypothetical protein